jgi:hypothetical protein
VVLMSSPSERFSAVGIVPEILRDAAYTPIVVTIVERPGKLIWSCTKPKGVVGPGKVLPSPSF